MLEELIEAGAGAGKNEIDPGSEANSFEKVPENIPTNRLEPLVTSDSASIPKILMAPVSDSAHIILDSSSAELPSMENQVCPEVEPAATLSANHDVFRFEPAASPLPEKHATSERELKAPLAGKREAETSIRHTVSRFGTAVAPSLEKQAALESERPIAQPVQHKSETARVAPNREDKIGVTPELERDSGNVQNQQAEFFVRYPSPGPSGHPLPSGEGCSLLSPPLSPHFKQSAFSKNGMLIQTDGTADDPTLLISNLSPITIAPAPIIKTANLIPETGAPIDATENRIPERMNLAEFDVTHFEYKTETEPNLSPVLQSAQMIQMLRTSLPIREIKPVKPASSFDTVMQNSSSQSELSTRPMVLTRPDEVQRVRLVFEPPPPPPVVRSVSMDIGDPESQVRVVIRERNGNLNVQLGSTNERLREDLQAAGPMLMRELQRNIPMPVTLDFSNFGSATDADSQSRSHSRTKKFLKPDAEFADVVETAYLPGPSSELKSL